MCISGYVTVLMLIMEYFIVRVLIMSSSFFQNGGRYCIQEGSFCPVFFFHVLRFGWEIGKIQNVNHKM